MARYRLTTTKSTRYYNSSKTVEKKFRKEIKNKPLIEQKVINNNGTYFWAEYIME